MTVLTEKQKEKEGKGLEDAEDKDEDSDGDNDEERPHTPTRRVIELTEYVQLEHMMGRGWRSDSHCTMGKKKFLHRGSDAYCKNSVKSTIFSFYFIVS